MQGSWSGSPISLAYQWQQCDSPGNNCVAISGAGNQTYTLRAEDVGHTIRVQETAANSAGSTSASSAPTLVIARQPSLPPPGEGAGGFRFIGSMDTMKLSKDQAGGGFTSNDANAVDLAASMATTHITVNTPLEDPSVILAWANRIHADGKHVWFRLSSSNGGSLPHGDLGDGYPTFGPGYLTTLHDLMIANPTLVKPGDILDGDAEAENSTWWASHYGCGVQAGCTPCNATGSNTPCAPTVQFNQFLTRMTSQENLDLASIGVAGCESVSSTNCVLTQVHSTDPGTAIHQLSNATVQAMGNLITVDAYPDQNVTEPVSAVAAWNSSIQSWHSAWQARGLGVTVLVGEWGYSNTINVTDSQQEAVIKAEVTSAFPTIPYLIGTNYWVGPGAAGDGGYTQIFHYSNGAWNLRPGASDVSSFYATMNGTSP
jgi:hypothetical protein